MRGQKSAKLFVSVRVVSREEVLFQLEGDTLGVFVVCPRVH